MYNTYMFKTHYGKNRNPFGADPLNSGHHYCYMIFFYPLFIHTIMVFESKCKVI